MTRTMPVTVAPTPLMIALRCQFDPLTLIHRTTIPAWDRVNAVKTPTTYSWINRVRLASNTQTSRQASPARTSTPLENTSRSPRLRNCDGMNRSLARIDDKRGKSWNDVFAASTRIPAVNTCSR